MPAHGGGDGPGGARPPEPADGGWERDRTAEGRDVAAQDRDSAADARDRRAGDRAGAADVRDTAARERAGSRARADGARRSPASRATPGTDDEQSAVDDEVDESLRAMAAADREAAEADRVADSADRDEAEHDRRAAAQDRAAAREDRAAAGRERVRAEAEREQAEVERATALPAGHPPMSAEELLRVVDALERAHCRVWLEGGWAVDALVGRRTRTHRDLDLDVDVADETAALRVLAGLGYVQVADHRPNRVELLHPQRGLVDLHFLTFDAAGDAVQHGEHGERWPCPAAAFTTGRVHGRVVGTLTAEQQVAWHDGYALRDVDQADLEQLRRLVRQARTGADGP